MFHAHHLLSVSIALPNSVLAFRYAIRRIIGTLMRNSIVYYKPFLSYQYDIIL